MADLANINSTIDRLDNDASTAEAKEGAPKKTEETASYKMIGSSRIPVPRATGALFKSRKDIAIGRLKKKKTIEAWDEAIAYYKNDHAGKRTRTNPDNPGGGSEENFAGGGHSATENIVFANVSAVVPAIYAKNPDVSVRSTRGESEYEFARVAQRLLRTLIQKRTAPGINLKPIARRAVVTTTLCNVSYVEVGYTLREHSSDATMQEIMQLSQNLEKAKSPQEVEAIEGEIAALVEKVDLLSPSGPWCKFRGPKDVIVDPDAMSPDLSDAKWIMIKDYVDTSFLNAVYRQKDKDGKLVSVYKPTHVLRASSDAGTTAAGHDIEINSFSLLDESAGDNYQDYGFDDHHSYLSAQRTKVWYVWDKTTRRQLMYADNDWTWPIWVWDDPYGLEEFFPIYPLAFHTDPEDFYARGEVSYYLDQQDEVNHINSQIKRMRHRVSNTIIYNKSVVQDENSLRSVIQPASKDGVTLIGVNIDPQIPLSGVVASAPTPALDHPQLFDKSRLLEAIDRVSGVSAVLKNVEYKTNTTNRAIESYEANTQTRLDEKIDAVEELIGRVAHAILVMCLQFMTREEVTELIGPEDAEVWPAAMSATEARKAFELTVIGGSSLKPTSQARKNNAMEMSQVLGQFAANNPVAFYLSIRVLSRAFGDEFDLNNKDWNELMQSVEQQLGQMQQPQQGGEGGAPAPAQQDAQQSQGGPQQVIAQLEQALMQMPPELQQQVGQAIAEGVPLSEILKQLQQMQQQPQQPA